MKNNIMNILNSLGFDVMANIVRDHEVSIYSETNWIVYYSEEESPSSGVYAEEFKLELLYDEDNELIKAAIFGRWVEEGTTWGWRDTSDYEVDLH